MQIQWYPGHMAKTRRQLQENLRLIDAVVEIADARAPAASRNPDFDALFSGKARIVLLNKADLADPEASAAWLKHYRAAGLLADTVVATNRGVKKAVTALIERAVRERVEAMRNKGVRKVVRCMIAGIPNSGKSTLINSLAGGGRAETGDRPGVTRSRQWVRISPYLELMDTPGLLWPKLGDEAQALRLAFLGSIKDDIMDVERLAEALLLELQGRCPEALSARYAALRPDTPRALLLEAVAESRGFLMKGGERDTERAARIALDEFRAGRIARVSLEWPEEADGKDR
ncbi:MAG: ribosome biogenesis GTPase YlqF [Clostridia bacterium]|nr:ribosome biogenesis GTPase YlqF [Clostridia bacterium]